MYTLAPSVFAADYIHLERQLAVMAEQGIRRLHIDIMDGCFVPSLSFGADFVKNLRPYTDLYFDVHLMVADPVRFVREFAEAGADGITIHCEACEGELKVERTLDEILEYGKAAGIALKPETSLLTIAPRLLKKVDVIQLMTVAPGRKGQHFIPNSYDRLRQLKEMIQIYENNTGKNIEIEVDGDITPDNLEQVLKAGADIVVVGKGLFTGSLNYNIETYKNLMNLVERERYAVHNWN